MKYELKDGQMIIVLDGRISSSNAEELSHSINEALANNPHNEVIFDILDVEYISSAGLRIFLNLKKNKENIKIINASNEVYEIFEVTGFTEVLSISKALKVISVEGKQLIGQGFMGKIYRYDEDTIVKVNYRVKTAESIQRERELAKKAFVLGVPTAISYDVVKIKEGGFGSMFELVKSSSLCELIINNPENLNQYVNIYKDTLLKIHEAEDMAETLPNKKETALSWVNDLRKYEVFEGNTLDTLQKMIEQIPDEDNLIHGDYHIKNIMMQDDEALLIDMDTLGRGNPIFELTPMFLTYHGYPATDPGNLQAFLGISDEVGALLFEEGVKALYPNKSEDEYKTIMNKCSLLGYMWLALKTLTFEPENEKRLNHAVSTVNELLKTIDSLVL